MKRYFKLYLHLMKMNLSILLEYRGAFFATFFAVILWSFFHVIMITLLTYRSNNFFGWTRNEMLLLTGAFSIFWGIFHVLFTMNFRRLSNLIDYGGLDYVLTKPLDSQFQTSFWMVNYVAAFRIFLGIGIVWYVMVAEKLHPSLVDYGLFFSIGMSGVVLLYSLWVIVSTILIWQPRLSNIIDFLYMVSGMTRYPSEMAKSMGNVGGLFILPLFLALSTPTEFLINRPDWNHVVVLLVSTAVLFVLSRIIWKNSLKYYTSANS